MPQFYQYCSSGNGRNDKKNVSSILILDNYNHIVLEENKILFKKN